eukprot:m.179423 g.179423  ORF g.179423 m.179423 type:complete len:125 (+) comp53423_c0_seq1:31-405(+)
MLAGMSPGFLHFNTWTTNQTNRVRISYSALLTGVFAMETTGKDETSWHLRVQFIIGFYTRTDRLTPSEFSRFLQDTLQTPTQISQALAQFPKDGVPLAQFERQLLSRAYPNTDHVCRILIPSLV